MKHKHRIGNWFRKYRYYIWRFFNKKKDAERGERLRNIFAEIRSSELPMEELRQLPHATLKAMYSMIYEGEEYAPQKIKNPKAKLFVFREMYAVRNMDEKRLEEEKNRFKIMMDDVLMQEVDKELEEMPPPTEEEDKKRIKSMEIVRKNLEDLGFI